MKKIVNRVLGYAALPILLLVTFQNCSKVGFTPKDSGFSSLESNNVPGNGCYFNGKSLSNGQSVTAYLNSTESTAACRYESRTCQNGVLSGSYNYASCAVGQPAACLFNGQTISHGSSVIAFSQSSGNCTSQSRSCNNGVLSGSYSYANCSSSQANSCIFNGQTVDHGQSILAYQNSSAPVGGSCASQNRTCNNGQLSGNYNFANCSVSQPNSCLFNGKTVAHGQTVNAYTIQNAGETPCNNYRESRTCNNGQLSGSAPFGTCTYTYYQWSTNRGVFGPCGGPEYDGHTKCTSSNVGEVHIGNHCGSGADAQWVCKAYQR